MEKPIITSSRDVLPQKASRRNFLRFTGAGIITTGLFLAGCDDDSDVVVLPPEAPSNLTVTQDNQGNIVLNFTDNADDETGFVVERSTAADTGFDPIATLGPNVTTFTDEASNLTPGTTYYYRVRAIRGTDVSEYTAVMSSVGGTALVMLPAGDAGVLNYAYALEQLEAAFYTAVLNGGYFASAPDAEKRILEDLREHEVAHREFFKAAISTVADPIPGLNPNFSAINFNDRSSVLSTAKTFENLGVAAYNGAGRLLENPDYLVIAGKIVSVEARHAAAIEDLVNPGSPFVDFITNGLDRALPPADVLQAAAPFIYTRIDASNLPS